MELRLRSWTSRLSRWGASRTPETGWCLSFGWLIVLALLLVLTYASHAAGARKADEEIGSQAGRGPTAQESGRWTETRRTDWGEFFVIFEMYTAGSDEEVWPGEEFRHRIVDGHGNVHGELAGNAISFVDFMDVDGDSVIDLVHRGNSGGVTGCCDFLEVWSIASGSPQELFTLWGGRGTGEGFELIDRGPGEPMAIRDQQYFYSGDIPYCCLPHIPRALIWEGDGFRDATRESIPVAIGEFLGTYRTQVLHMAQRQNGGSSTGLEAAAIGVYAAARVIGATRAEEEWEWLGNTLPTEVFDRMQAIREEIDTEIAEPYGVSVR